MKIPTPTQEQWEEIYDALDYERETNPKFAAWCDAQLIAAKPATPTHTLGDVWRERILPALPPDGAVVPTSGSPTTTKGRAA
jgi:hypothetical protein